MKYRIFGKTGEKVSVLGYGNMRLPVVNNDYSRVDEKAALRLVRHAVDNGVNYLDTSWVYHGGLNGAEEGASEPFVGHALREIGRDRVFVATKLPSWLVQTRQDMDKYLDSQLASLGTDHIDFYLVHNVIPAVWPRMMDLGIGDFLDSAKKSGKIRYAGFSFHGTPELFHETIDYYPFDFCQHVINYFDVNYQAGLANLLQAARRGMGLVAMEPVMGGVLGDRLPQKAKDEFARTGIRRSPAGWSLRWVWNNPEVSVLLSGMHTMEQLEENLRLAGESDAPLALEELQTIGRVVKILHEKDDVPCTECGMCVCPFGVAIKDNFAAYNANLNLDVTYVSDKNYDLMLRDNGDAAEKCNRCGRCAYTCPQGIDIPNALRRVSLYFASHKPDPAWH